MLSSFESAWPRAASNGSIAAVFAHAARGLAGEAQAIACETKKIGGALAVTRRARQPRRREGGSFPVIARASKEATGRAGALAVVDRDRDERRFVACCLVRTHAEALLTGAGASVACAGDAA